MGWGTILEGIDKETKLCHCSFRGETENVEHLLLKFTIVDTKTSATHLYSVANEVVCHGAHLFGMLVKQWNVIGIG